MIKVLLLFVVFIFLSQKTSQAQEIRKVELNYSKYQIIAYSPFRELDRTNEVINKDNVEKDLLLIIKAGFNAIRTFDSSDAIAKTIFEVIEKKSLPLKVILGIHIESNHNVFNQAEIQRGIVLANQYQKHVLAVSVGNEILMQKTNTPLPRKELIAYISQVRSNVKQPITTNEVWLHYLKAPVNLLKVIDFASINAYPYFSEELYLMLKRSKGSYTSEEVMNESMVIIKENINSVKKYFRKVGFEKMPILIGETGWKTKCERMFPNKASQDIQVKYFEKLHDWLKSEANELPLNIVFFQAFDEPSKKDDDGWGVFNNTRQPKKVIQKYFKKSELYDESFELLECNM